MKLVGCFISLLLGEFSCQQAKPNRWRHRRVSRTSSMAGLHQGVLGRTQSLLSRLWRLHHWPGLGVDGGPLLRHGPTQRAPHRGGHDQHHGGTGGASWVAEDAFAEIGDWQNPLSVERQRRDVESVTIHEGFDPETLENDICLVEVRTPWIWTVTVEPIALATQTSPEGTNCNIAGWGFISENDTTISTGSAGKLLNCCTVISWNGNLDLF